MLELLQSIQILIAYSSLSLLERKMMLPMQHEKREESVFGWKWMDSSSLPKSDQDLFFFWDDVENRERSRSIDQHARLIVQMLFLFFLQMSISLALGMRGTTIEDIFSPSEKIVLKASPYGQLPFSICIYSSHSFGSSVICGTLR